MRHYFYKRMDSPGGGDLLYQWKTTHDLKLRAMNQYKNGIELGRIRPRSTALLDEMNRIVNDEGNIGAEGRSKDDRVMGAALSYQAWNTWVQPKVKAMGLTWAKATEIEEKGGTPPTERIITQYLLADEHFVAKPRLGRPGQKVYQQHRGDHHRHDDGHHHVIAPRRHRHVFVALGHQHPLQIEGGGGPAGGNGSNRDCRLSKVKPRCDRPARDHREDGDQHERSARSARPSAARRCGIAMPMT